MPIYAALTRRPTWAWKPALMVDTELREPHDSHVTKNRRFSLPRSVSDDLQILHVTYSTVKSQRKDKACRVGATFGRSATEERQRSRQAGPGSLPIRRAPQACSTFRPTLYPSTRQTIQLEKHEYSPIYFLNTFSICF